MKKRVPRCSAIVETVSTSLVFFLSCQSQMSRECLSNVRLFPAINSGVERSMYLDVELVKTGSY